MSARAWLSWFVLMAFVAAVFLAGYAVGLGQR